LKSKSRKPIGCCKSGTTVRVSKSSWLHPRGSGRQAWHCGLPLPEDVWKQCLNLVEDTPFVAGYRLRRADSLQPCFEETPMTARDIQNNAARILVVEDHAFFRQGLVAWINRQPDLTCCGDVDSGAAARKAVSDLKPDLVLLDLGLQDEDGLELIRSLLDDTPSLRILVISQKDESVFAERALRAGALGYLMKEEATEEVLSAIRYVLRGEIHLSHRMAARLLKRSLEDGKRHDDAAGELELLSDRELRVFEMLGAGLSNPQIAGKMGISVKTIETHRENIKHKLRLEDAKALKAAAAMWVECQEAP
jgi:DNA-binding NarL/FixJ family response regulator